MKPQVNICVVVDVIGALSGQTLAGNLCLVDDGAFHSSGQGTPQLCTIVVPGQVVKWTALAVDVQTPVEIKSITFLGPENAAADGEHSAPEQVPGPDDGRLDLADWSGVVPAFLPHAVPQHYRLELQMRDGEDSVLHIDSPALMRL